MSRHGTAILQAVFVTFLWSTSWVLIKFGLAGELPPLTFAGVRYTLAVVALAPWVLARPELRGRLRSLPRRDLGRLVLYGLVLYTVTQGMLFVSLSLLPANPVTLVLNLTPLLVVAASLRRGGEPPTALQAAGVLLAAIGTAAYFLPLGTVALSGIGLAALLVCLVSNAASSLLGRSINRDLDVPPLGITFVSMAAGSLALLVTGVAVQGVGTWRPVDGLIVTWLAVLNTAVTFTLWNRTLRTLTAVESSILNGLMLPQIVLLAYLFLGEAPSLRQIFGLALVALGTIVVQLRRPTTAPAPAEAGLPG
ncbi:MAG TPA: DMT family transporter [Anaerolineales bacterium]|nr:DMT family transporter [Anaerolineales bacterium]